MIQNPLHFTPTEQQQLLMLARQSIAAALDGLPPPEIPPEAMSDGLRLCRAAFVTITKRGELRGCIGRMDYERSVWENVRYAAAAAAMEDPRFPSLDHAELPAISLSISILEPPVVLESVDQFDPQEQGIIVERGMRHGLLLPKVAQDYGWTAEQTLTAVCQKAGLAADAWQDPETRLSVFTAIEFGEV